MEDDPQVGLLLVKLLTRAGYTVQHVANGSDAWDLLLDSFDRIELVITDNNLPGFTGLELVQLIRQTTYRGGVIVHCGALNASDQAAYDALNVDSIVLKDVTATQLLAAVAAVRAKGQHSA